MLLSRGAFRLCFMQVSTRLDKLACSRVGLSVDVVQMIDSRQYLDRNGRLCCLGTTSYIFLSYNYVHLPFLLCMNNSWATYTIFQLQYLVATCPKRRPSLSRLSHRRHMRCSCATPFLVFFCSYVLLFHISTHASEAQSSRCPLYRKLSKMRRYALSGPLPCFDAATERSTTLQKY